jgi:hypothetical protein
MKCAYCLEELNDGASVCRICGRRQPLNPTERRRRNNSIALGVVALLAAGGVVYYFYDSYAEDAAIQDVLACYQFHGQKDATFDTVKREVERSNSTNYRGWRYNLTIMNIVVGCYNPEKDSR